MKFPCEKLSTELILQSDGCCEPAYVVVEPRGVGYPGVGGQSHHEACHSVKSVDFDFEHQGKRLLSV